MEERQIIDDTLVNLEYYCIKMALYLAEVLDTTARNLCLDKDLTPEFKHSLKTDMGFTSTAIKCLTKAEKNYKGMLKALGQLELILDSKLKPGLFDGGLACTFDLLRLNIAYMMISYGNDENERKIHEFLRNEFEWDDDLKRVYGALTQRIQHLMAQQKTKEE